jgi:peptide chain release factor 1
MEVKSAAGGIESSLFAEDLVNMYKFYISKMGWNIDTLSYAADSGLGKGCKNGSFKLTGQSIYKYFKYEAGVHKVQRVPITEKNGRIHSSTCQVAILADVKYENTEINERDLRVDYYRAGGAGGQHVNKTESAVRITHLPTGIVVQNQDERDQHMNKARAMEVLKQRVNNRFLDEFNSSVASVRKSQVGMGNLSEKVRTYNWPDSRVTGKIL